MKEGCELTNQPIIDWNSYRPTGYNPKECIGAPSTYTIKWADSYCLEDGSG